MTPANPNEIDGLMQQMVERTVGLAVAKRLRPDIAQILVKLNRLAGLLGIAGKPAKGAGEQAESLVLDFGKMLGKSTKQESYAKYVSEMMADLNRLAAITGMWSSPKIRPLLQNKPRRSNFDITFYVHSRGGEEELVEHREKRKDFYISKNDYAAAVKAVSETIDNPLKFSSLHDFFIKHGGRDVSSQYPLRVVLRFWQSTDPSLVLKERARYAPVATNISEFRRQAAKAWNALAH